MGDKLVGQTHLSGNKMYLVDMAYMRFQAGCCTSVCCIHQNDTVDNCEDQQNLFYRFKSQADNQNTQYTIFGKSLPSIALVALADETRQRLML